MLVSEFIVRHFRHYNSRALVDAAKAYQAMVQRGGKMILALAGAMSTAEIGRSLAEMIRQEKVHAICCTGANLEEDLFNLIGNHDYVGVSNYRYLNEQDELLLKSKGLHRVTDICIPESVMIAAGDAIASLWRQLDQKRERTFFHELFYRVVKSSPPFLKFSIPPSDSWLVAAAEKNIPIFVPGWEDSTLGNTYAADVIKGLVRNVHTIKSGVEYAIELVNWYTHQAQIHQMGFFQIGGGIAGDFAICAAPLIREELQRSQVPMWSYFCQIGDSTTSYGSYSGAPPNEKITWGKLDLATDRFIVESDATIVAPLIFAYVLGW